MATITIKCNTLGCFNGIECLSGINTAFSNAKKATDNLAQAVEKLTIKLDAVKDLSELDSVKENLQHTEQREAENNSALCCAYEKLDEFVSEVGRIDNAVAEKIQERKDEFYKQYYYLKPECEKGTLEKIGNWFVNTWNGFVDWTAQLGQAIADAFVSLGKWIKEHITELCTALAVILLAVLAFIATPLTLIAIAAIAGIVSLALWVTDIICIVSCDKNLAGILRENGNEYWADVVDGVQWGCGIVELLFPASLLASSIKKIGLKAFGKAMIQSFKSSFKSFIDDVFRSGKKGFSNLFKRISKLVFDPDDFKNLKPKVDADVVLTEVQEGVLEQSDKLLGEVVDEIGGNTSTVQKVFTDNPFDEAGDLKPNIKYQTGEFKYNYETDGNGRISNWNTDNLQLTERDSRLNYNSDTPGKIEGDHAGHLAGDRFGGSSELDNIVSQSQNVNLSQYKKIENEWAKAISDGKEVMVNVDIKYDGDGLRPIEFYVEYTIDGDFFSQSILN